MCGDFVYKDTTNTEIYTLSLHDALPIFCDSHVQFRNPAELSLHAPGILLALASRSRGVHFTTHHAPRSEEHTSELQSRRDLVCRLLLEKKKDRHILSTPHSSTWQTP